MKHMDAQDAKLWAEAGAAREKKKELALTPGQKKTDESFAKEYADYYHSGGKANVEKSFKQMQNAITALEGGPIDPKTGKRTGNANLTGGISTVIPGTGSDWAQDYINPEMAAVRDDIRSAIQSSLKQILGGQYTEKEGIDVFNRAFNPRLSAKENIKRAQFELDRLESMAAAKDAAAKQFLANGTLKGHNPGGTNLGVGQRNMYANQGGNGGGGLLPAAHANSGRPQKVTQNGRNFIWNEETGKYEKEQPAQ
jgi:hypothetical protein